MGGGVRCQTQRGAGRHGELAGPGPVLGETEDDLPSSMHDAGSGVQEPEAQRLGFGPGQLSVQAGQAKPRQQVGAGQHQLEPSLVGFEAGEGQSVEAAVTQGLDGVLYPGVETLATLQLEGVTG